MTTVFEIAAQQSIIIAMLRSYVASIATLGEVAIKACINVGWGKWWCYDDVATYTAIELYTSLIIINDFTVYTENLQNYVYWAD